MDTELWPIALIDQLNNSGINMAIHQGLDTLKLLILSK